MATARDKLISDWRERLAAAEAVDTTAESRPAWLARLQIRLYRFLLSLYGDAEWTTAPPRRAALKSAADEALGAVVFDSSAALPLAGKPPKSLGQIQAVLKSVANAQTQTPPAGPLTQGLPPESWVTVALAASKHWHRINRVTEMLSKRGIESRLQFHGSRYVLEVHATDFEQAVQIARQLPPQPARVVIARQSEPGPLAPYFVHVMVIAAVVGLSTGQLATIGFAALQLGVNYRDALDYYRAPVLCAAFFAGWILGATAIVAGANALDLLFVAGRNSFQTVKRRTTVGFLGALGWRCLSIGFFVGPLLALVAVGVVGNLDPHSEAAAFFAVWLLSIVAVVAIYFARKS